MYVGKMGRIFFIMVSKQLQILSVKVIMLETMGPVRIFQFINLAKEVETFRSAVL